MPYHLNSGIAEKEGRMYIMYGLNGVKAGDTLGISVTDETL